MNATREIHFRDRRPPQEIQFELERELMTLLRPATGEPGLVLRADSKMNGVPHRFVLRFEAALSRTNCYWFQAEVPLAGLPSDKHDAIRKSLSGWFDLWTRAYKPSTPPLPGEGSRDRYEALAAQALSAEAHLGTVPPVQQAILEALRNGATFSTAHKEGGTNIRFANGQFVRADYGESNRTEKFPDQAAFLAFLRQFYDWQTSRNTYPEKASEFDAWKLTLRLLRPPGNGGGGGNGSAMRMAVPALAVSAAKFKLAVIFGLVVLAVFVAAGLAFKVFSVKSYGYPLGASVRTRDYVATLIKTTEPYAASLHRDPTKDRHRLDLLLHPLDGGAPRRLIRIAGGLQLSPANFKIGVLGAEGDLVWIVAHELVAFDLKADKLITEKDLLRINPELGDLLQVGHVEFDGRLRVSSRDNLRAVEFDPVTLKAQPAGKPTRTNPFATSDKPETFLCAGVLVSPPNWFGVRSTSEVERDFKPGATVSGDYPVDTAKQVRRLHQVRVDASTPRPRVVSSAQLSSEEFLDAALIRRARAGEPLRLSEPDGFLMAYRSKSGLEGTWIVARVNLSGQIKWKADTGIADLDQILPGQPTTALVGRKSKIPGKVQEPVLAIIPNDSGAVTTHALVQDRTAGGSP